MEFITQDKPTQVAEALKSGKVALLPTDTVYGLAAIPTSEAAIDKIFALKERPRNVNLPILVAQISDIENLGLLINDNAMSVLKSPFVPGAITLVLGFVDGAARPAWLDGREEVAVRIPNNAFLLSVLQQTGPLLATSANRHRSQANISLVTEILEDINGAPDVVVDAGRLSFIPSTILNCRHEKIAIEREGQITQEQLKNYIHHE